MLVKGWLQVLVVELGLVPGLLHYQDLVQEVGLQLALDSVQLLQCSIQAHEGSLCRLEWEG